MILTNHGNNMLDGLYVFTDHIGNTYMVSPLLVDEAIEKGQIQSTETVTYWHVSPDIEKRLAKNAARASLAV